MDHSNDRKRNEVKKEEEKSDNIVKNASGEANHLVHETVDASGNIVKTISGKDGLIGKAFDSSGNIMKNASSKGNEYIDKSVDSSSKAFRHAKEKMRRKKKE